MRSNFLKHSIFLCFLGTAWVTNAEEIPFASKFPLNRISYPLTVERWATTETAKVTVSMDAILDKIGLDTVNAHVLNTLNKLATSVNWHMTQFNRNQDKSGLEMLHVEAEARVPQSLLAGLRQKAKEVSKAGETYTVNDIDFTPSVSEIEKTHQESRAAIYEQIKQQLAHLNQLYPDQHYFIHQIDFVASPAQAAPMAFGKMNRMVAEGNMTVADTSTPSLLMNTKITETAQVVIAAQLASAAHVDGMAQAIKR